MDPENMEAEQNDPNEMNKKSKMEAVIAKGEVYNNMYEELE